MAVEGKRYAVGIDGGSTFCKAALLEGDRLLAGGCVKSGWQPAVAADELFSELLAQRGIDRAECRVIATGYSRDRIPFADRTLTEITAHARGAVYLSPGIGGVVDIGGQDSKVIRLEAGRVAEFQMNDKCAAGTGRFVEMACRTLEIRPDEADRHCLLREAAPINSMCAVFAESEIIGLIAAGTGRERILGGVMRAIASRIAQMLAKTCVPAGSPLLMTGGLAGMESLRRAIAEASGRELLHHENSILAGAIGAALCATAKPKETGTP